MPIAKSQPHAIILHAPPPSSCDRASDFMNDSTPACRKGFQTLTLTLRLTCQHWPFNWTVHKPFFRANKNPDDKDSGFAVSFLRRDRVLPVATSGPGCARRICNAIPASNQDSRTHACIPHCTQLPQPSQASQRDNYLSYKGSPRFRNPSPCQSNVFLVRFPSLPKKLP